MAEGTITRKDIITDGALKWGDEYARTLNEAIVKNKEFVDSIILLNKENVKLRRSEDQTEFIKQKNEVKLISQKAIATLKEQEVAEVSLAKVKDAAIRTEKLEIDLAKKKQALTRTSTRLTIEEKLANQILNREKKEAAILSSRMIGAYQKLNLQRTIAKKNLLDLLAAENQNTAAIRRAEVEFSRLDVRVRRADQAVGDFGKSVGNYPQLKGLTSGLRNLVGAFGLMTGAALFAGALKDLYGVLKDFDRQLIAVGKTTNISGESLKQFGREVVELGDRLDGVSIDGLLKSAEVAGQLGVKGTGNILRFSEAVEKLKLTSDIVTDEQVQNFAQFIQVSSDSFENAGRLASVMTQLGNNFATTEAKILSNSTEIQKGIAVYTTSAEGVLGLGAATASLGSEAESSRSAIQTTFKVINDAVAKGANLEEVLRLTSLTQKELSEQFREDATGVFQKFVKGLALAKDEGENLSIVLEDLGIKEKRAFTVVGSLAANYEVLEDAMAKSREEYTENLALNQEVAAATQSLDSIVGDIVDKYEAYILTADDANSGTQKLATGLKFLRDNFAEIANFIIRGSAVLITFFATTKLVNGATILFAAIKTAATAAQVSFALATGIGTKKILLEATAIRSATVAQQGMNVAMRATPWGIIIALLLATTVAYAAFNKELDDQASKIQKIIDARKKLQDIEGTYSSARDKNRAKDFSAIESEMELRRANGEDRNKLEKEEIERKKESVRAQLSAYEGLKESESKRTISEIKGSEARIAQMKIESEAGSTNGARKDELEEIIRSESQKLEIKKAALYDNSKLQKEESEKLNSILSGLDKKEEINKAVATADEIEAEEKAAKERLRIAKKISDSLYEVKKQGLKRIIKINSDIGKDEEVNDEDRIKALETVQEKEVQLSELNKKNALDYDKFVLQAERLNANEKLVIAREAENEIIDINKNTAEEILKIKRFNSEDYEKELEEKVSKTNESMNAELEAENQRFAMLGDLERLAQADRESAVAEHEQRIFDIKKEFALKVLRLQIANLQSELLANDILPASDQISADKRQKIAEALSKAKLDLSEVEISNNRDKNEISIEIEREQSEQILQISAQLTGALSDLANAFTERKIQNIEEEISENDEKYGRLIELAGNDIKQKELLEKERDKKNEVLEKKKRAAQHKQAVYDKAAALAQAGIMTALAVLNALNSKPFLPMGPIMATLAGVLGAIQIGTIIATPIPKYRTGRKGGKAETAIVGDGNVSEVITSADGSNARVTPNIPTITNLAEGDIVHKSMADYKEYLRSSILSGIKSDSIKMNNFKETQNVDLYGKESLSVMKETLAVLRRQRRANPESIQKVDINHHLWKMGNTNWKN
jgi:hypothetical protein